MNEWMIMRFQLGWDRVVVYDELDDCTMRVDTLDSRRFSLA